MQGIDLAADNSAYLPADLYVCELSLIIPSPAGPGTVALAIYREIYQGGRA